MIVRPHNLGVTLGVSGGTRAPGVHMSDLYNDLYEQLEPKRYDKSQPMNMLRIEAGLSLEAVMEEGLARRLDVHGGERVGEMQTGVEWQSIAYNPDLLITDPDGSLRGGEIKCTWMSAREWPISPSMERETGIPSNWDGASSIEFPPKAGKYFTQMKVYGFHIPTPLWRLIVFFVNGNYRPPSPALLSWDLEFTPQEMAEEWKMCWNHGLYRKILKGV